MRATLKYALIFSGGSILTKIVLWEMGYLEKDATISSMVYLFALLISIFVALDETKVKEQTTPTSYSTDFKVAMQSVAFFSIFVALFSYVFYKFIDWEFMYDRIASKMAEAEAFVLTLENNPHNLTREEFLENERKLPELIYSPFTHSSITLFGFTFIGAIYSAILTFIVRLNPKYKNLVK